MKVCHSLLAIVKATDTNWATHAEDAEIHVISALLISKSFPTKEVITVIPPIVKEFIAIAIVAVRTKRIS